MFTAGSGSLMCANHFSTIISELPAGHHIFRKVSAADSRVKHIRGGGLPADPGRAKRKGIKMPDDSIWTGYYSDWDKMSKADNQTVMDTRKKNKAKDVTPGKKKGGDLKSQIAELKRSIASSIRSVSSESDSGRPKVGRFQCFRQ